MPQPLGPNLNRDHPKVNKFAGTCGCGNAVAAGAGQYRFNPAHRVGLAKAFVVCGTCIAAEEAEWRSKQPFYNANAAAAIE